MDDLIAKIAFNKKKLDELLKNKDNWTVLNKWLKTELTYTSNALEGNTLTRRETALAIDAHITSASKPIVHYLEAVNHAKAYEFIIDQMNDSAPLDEKVVLHLHQLILSGINDDNAGFYRSVRVHISGSNTILPNPLKVPDLMQDFGQWLSVCDENVINFAIEAHYRLVSIHPFIDGNGRTSRLLMNLILLKNGYAPIIIRPIDRRRYLMTLEQRQTTGNALPYTKFMLTACNRSLKMVVDLLDVTQDVDRANLLTISKFAKAVGVSVSTIRYWVETNKIKPVAYTQSGYMLFDINQKKCIKI